MLITEGESISADARLLAGSLEVDLSTLTGESVPERQIKRATRLIAFVAIGVGLAFLPIGLAAGLGLSSAASFAIGLLVANVPEGLLPTITLALAVGVRDLARRGALVKRLSAVETLGSTSVICTDETGTLTENRMRVADVWAPDGQGDRQRPQQLARLAGVAAACSGADLADGGGKPTGDPTELALLELASQCGADIGLTERQRHRRALFRFDPRIKLMTTVDETDSGLTVNTKGAPEEVLARAGAIWRDNRATADDRG